MHDRPPRKVVGSVTFFCTNQLSLMDGWIICKQCKAYDFERKLFLVWFQFGFVTGPRLKVQYTAHRTFSMADSLTVGLTPC